MNTKDYICNHCGHRFKAEEKENLECPSCYWSSSVVPEETGKDDQTVSASRSDIFQKGPSRKVAIPWKRLIMGMCAVVFLGFLIWVVFPHLSTWYRDHQKVLNAWVRQSFSRGVMISEEKELRQQIPDGRDPLSNSERAILKRQLQITGVRPVSSAERQVLEYRVPFKTGYVEKLPSQGWSLENFKEMLENQERFYQMPLPRSYRKKLFEGFESQYLPAVEAFQSGDILHARNLWVESLGFPVYLGNIQKHRGVVLTIIRPFIADTLSKIGAINTMLMEKGVRDYERAIAEAYESLFVLFEEQAWLEASDLIAGMNHKIETLQNPSSIAETLPAYPAVSQVDQGIQATLMDLLEAPPPAMADFRPMKNDLETKQRIAESFIDANLVPMQEHYEAAFDFIQKGQWDEALERLGKIQYPLALVQDAQEKITILKNLQKNKPPS